MRASTSEIGQRIAELVLNIEVPPAEGSLLSAMASV
jgi:hypothetical protein